MWSGLMKKFILWGILLCFMVSCSKSEEAQRVDDMISTMGVITIDSENKILDLESVVNNLDPSIRKELDNLSKLESARKEYNQLCISIVEDEISSISIVDSKSYQQITKAEKAYEELSDDLKSFVSNFERIEMSKQELIQHLADEIDSQINDIGIVSVDSYSKISLADKTYRNADEEVKILVQNYDVLSAALDTFYQLQVQHVVTLIDSLGTITLNSEPEIDNASKNLYILPSEHRENVVNKELLIQAETQLISLKNGVIDENNRVTEENNRIEARNIIRVSKVQMSSKDSAGGLYLYVNFTNNSPKTIKYIRVSFTFYNAVNDPIVLQYKTSEVLTGEMVGPFATGEGISDLSQGWGKFYNWTIDSVKLVKIQIEYMDGTTETLTGKDLEYVQY